MLYVVDAEKSNYAIHIATKPSCYMKTDHCQTLYLYKNMHELMLTKKITMQCFPEGDNAMLCNGDSIHDHNFTARAPSIISSVVGILHVTTLV